MFSETKGLVTTVGVDVLATEAASGVPRSCESNGKDALSLALAPPAAPNELRE